MCSKTRKITFTDIVCLIHDNSMNNVYETIYKYYIGNAPIETSYHSKILKVE